MKIKIRDISAWCGGICVTFIVEVNDVTKDFYSFLENKKILNLDQLSIFDLAWDNIYSEKIEGWLQTKDVYELLKIENIIYIPKIYRCN
jgi:hypothetical protein